MKIFFPLLICIFSFQHILAQNQKIIQTPEECFNNLPDYSFTPNFIEVEDGLKMHYIDEGDKNDPIILLLHGEPSWSYVYRNIIPILTKKGYRVVAPDLIGFGKSDKYNSFDPYTYANHTKWLSSFVKELMLKDIHLFAHDWGGMLGLRIVAERPDLFASVIVSYSYLFTGEEIFPESFLGWQNYALKDSTFNPGTVMNWATNTALSQDVIAAYNAPYPNEQYMYGVRIFPSIIPADTNDKESIRNKELMDKLRDYNNPFLTVWGNHPDETWISKNRILQNEIAGAKGQIHRIIESNHFIQEDQPKLLSEIILDFISNK